MMHYVKNISIDAEVPENLSEIVFGAGCFGELKKNFGI